MELEPRRDKGKQATSFYLNSPICLSSSSSLQLYLYNFYYHLPISHLLLSSTLSLQLSPPSYPPHLSAMALQTNQSGVSPLEVPNLHNISHEVMDYQAVGSTALALWSAGGGDASISQVYFTYTLATLFQAWKFQVAIMAFILLVFAVMFCNTNARNRETEARNRETASKERIAQMQMEMELEKTRIQVGGGTWEKRKWSRNPPLTA